MNALTMSRFRQDMAHDVVDAWRSDGAFRLSPDETGIGLPLQRAFASSRRFFGQSARRKARFTNDLTYAGYVAPGEERGSADADAETEGESGEAFIVCQDVAPDDPRVREGWPCHGPVPWPDAEFRRAMLALNDELCAVADRLLRQVALGLGLDDPDVFARLTWSGWHHLRTEHVPGWSAANAADAAKDDGLLVIVMQDESGALTVMPGAVMRFVAGAMPSPTPAAAPHVRDWYSMTYFHVPNFQACVRSAASASGDDCLHYGTHFTETFMRRYPERATTLRIHAEKRLAVLAGLREQAARAAIPI